jgi:hypothetical protein
VITANQDAHTTTADQDTNDLEDSVADLKEEEGDDDDTDDSPEVDKLGGQDVGVSVGQNSKVVSLNVQERHDQILPAILDGNLPPAADTVLVEEYGGVDEEHEDVVEDGLEGGDVGASLGEEAGEGVGRSNAQSENLAESEDNPEVDGGQVAVPMDRLDLKGVDALANGGILVGGCRGGRGLDGVGGWAFGVAHSDGLLSRHVYSRGIVGYNLVNLSQIDICIE